MYDDFDGDIKQSGKSKNQGQSIIDEEPELNTDVEFSNLNEGEKIINKIKTGSFTNSIFALFAFSPIITLFLSPFAFSKGGLIINIIMFSLIMFCSYISSNMLLRMITDKKFINSFQLISNYGERTLNIMNIICHIIFYFGNILIFMKFSYILLSEMKEYFSLSSSNGVFSNINFIYLIIALVVQFPLSFLKNEKVQISIQLINLLLYLIMGIALIISFFVQGDKIKNKKYWFITPELDYILVIAIYFLVGFNHLHLFNVVKNLRLYSKKRGHTLINVTLLIQFSLFIVYGFFGFFTTFNNTTLFFFSHSKFTNSVIFSILKVLLILSMQTSISFSCIKIKDSIAMFCNKSIYIGAHFMISLLSISLSNVIIIFCTTLKIEGVICIIGGLCVGILGYFIPITIYLKVCVNISEENAKLYRIFSYVMLFLGIAITSIGIAKYFFIS